MNSRGKKGVAPVFTRILVGMDTSEAAGRALDVALDLAEKYGAELRVLFVIALPEYGATVGEVEEARSEGRKIIAPVLEQATAKARQRNIPCETRVYPGHPAETLINYASQEHCDLIVVGRRGSSPAKRFLLGSVSTRVTQYAPCHVLVVK